MVKVRRAVLPWRRRIRPSRFDVPDVGDAFDIPVLGILLFIVFMPLYLLWFLLVAGAAAELLAELVVLPGALIFRRLRRSWPVQVLSAEGRVVYQEHLFSFTLAGQRKAELMKSPGLPSLA